MTNNDESTQSCQSVNELLSGYLDNELTQQDVQRVALHVKTCQQCKVTLSELEQLKTAVNGSEMPDLEQDKLEALLNEPVSKLMQTLGWIACLSGIAIVLVYGVVTFFMGTDMSATQKLITSVIWGGFIGVFLGVARQQLHARKTDKYKGVKL